MKTGRPFRSSSASGTQRQYRLIGLIILIVLAIVAAATAGLVLLFDAESVKLTAVILGLATVCALLAFGVLYLLFTVEQTFQAIGSKMSDERAATLRATASPPGISAPTVAPTIEYGRESRDVEILEGIGTVFSRRLARNDIATLDDLRSATVAQVSAAAQVGEPIAQRWKLMADLMLVRAIDAQAAELLVLCGVESVEELAHESAEPLVRKARLVNQSQKARIYPAELNVGIVEGWIEAAKAQTIPGGMRSHRGRFGRGKTPA